jgi:hypothetical protein
MTSPPPNAPPPSLERVNRDLSIARLLLVITALLPLLPLVYVVMFSGDIAASPDQGQALFEQIRRWMYVGLVASCLLLPIVIFFGFRLIFAARTITQKPYKGRMFLGAGVLWVSYAFLVVALYILWFV